MTRFVANDYCDNDGSHDGTSDNHSDDGRPSNLTWRGFGDAGGGDSNVVVDATGVVGVNSITSITG